MQDPATTGITGKSNTEFAKVTTPTPGNMKLSLGRIAFLLSFVVVATSLLDLLVNRLLFRSGPDALAHLDFPGIADAAVIGRISFTFEQLALFVILGFAAFVLLREENSQLRRLGLIMIPQLLCAALLYLPLPWQWTWALSTVLVLTTALEIFGLVLFRATSPHFTNRTQILCERVFLGAIALGFFFPLYYHLYLLLGAINLAMLPFGTVAYTAGIYTVMAASVAALFYAVTTPTPQFKVNVTNIAKATALPTLIVVPFLYGLFQSFFMTQIFSLVIAMSTDITLSFDFVRIIVLFSWFLLTAVVFLALKGRRTETKFLLQQAAGLVMILSTTFLFNYPNYLLLGTAGVLLLCYPLRGRGQT